MPYWRLSGYYLFYFASLGALVPYWALYLQAKGFDALAIGQLMAILSVTKIVAPMVWGHIVDRTGQRVQMVRLGALVTVLGFLTVFLANGFWGMAFAMLVFSFFWNASLPQMEAITFNHLRDRPTRYALVRLWGSVGFVLVVLALGVVLEDGSIDRVPIWMLWLTACVWLSSLWVPDSPPSHGGHPPPALRRLLRRPDIVALLGASFLMQLSHGIYYAFYSIHLTSAGYDSIAVGRLWALGVVAEVLIFLVMHRLLERFGARRVLLWSLGLAAVRWFSIGAYVDALGIQVIAQILHAATFGTFHASAIHLVHQMFPGRTQGRGQAIYNSLSFGAGGAAGSLIGGSLWTDSGPLVTFGVGAAAAVCGLAVVWYGIKGELRDERSGSH